MLGRRIWGVSGLLAAAAVAAMGCSDGPMAAPVRTPDALLAKGGGGGGGGTSVTVAVSDQPVGVAADGDPFTVTIPSSGGLDIRPACSTDDRLRLVGMDAALGTLGARSTCNGKAGQGFVFLKVLVSTTTPNGACPGATAPEQTVNGTNFGVTNRYFFQVNSDGDGRYDDAQYTIVFTDCTVNSRRVTATTGDLYEWGTLIAPGIAIGVDFTY